jgi:dihydroflavonol-4-reductase
VTVLVTGATGFVGAAVARALRAQGAALRLLCRPDSDRRNLQGLDADVLEGDLLDAGALTRAVQGCEAVFHVAADYRLWVPDPEPMYQTNVTATVNLLRAAADAGVGRIVYTSSVATLALPRSGERGDEATSLALADAVGHYKRSKLLAEALVARHVAEEGWPVVIVNPSTPLGPGDVRPTPTGRIVLDAARGRMPAYVDTGLNVVHVDDVASGHLLALRHGTVGQRYILGGEDLSLKRIIDSVTEQVGRPGPRLRLPHRAVLPVALASELWARLSGAEPLVTADGVRMSMRSMYFSSSKAREQLGYRARPAVQAIEDALVWFRDNGYL